MIFLSCKANARVYDAKLGHGLHSPPPGAAASLQHLKKSRKPTVCDWASLGSEPRQSTKQSLSLPLLVQCHLRASLWLNQSRPSALLQNC